MTPKTRAWLLIVLLSLISGLSIAGVVWYRSRELTPAKLLKRLPTDEAVIVYIDFAALRRGGILQMLDGSKMGEEAEYREFVAKTEFDYKQDLDTAIVALAPTGKFMLLKGRFDWQSLKTYVQTSDGKCNNSFCRMTGSQPDRRISFFPMQSGLMALAVATDESAASRMNTVDSRPDREIPNAPIWISIPPNIVHSGQPLPEGTKMFVRSLEHAQYVTLALTPEGTAFAARLNVQCANEADAAELARQLTKTTNLLRDMMAHDRIQPNANDLTGFLTSGAFTNEGARVRGYWPIPRAMIETLLAGS
jgi:hypothetical protein